MFIWVLFVGISSYILTEVFLADGQYLSGYHTLTGTGV